MLLNLIKIKKIKKIILKLNYISRIPKYKKYILKKKNE